MVEWLGDWSKRREITIDSTKIDEDLTHFPITVSLGTAVGQTPSDVSSVFDELGTAWPKVAFTDNTGTAQIYGEMEQWDATNEKGVFHVSDSALTLGSATDTSIYMYYDSTQPDNTTYIGDTGNRTEVWDSNYVLVYHMNQDPSGTAPQIIDSTSNNNDGTSNGSMTSGDLVRGKIGEALDLDGTDDYIESGYTPPQSPMTANIWIKPVVAGNARLFGIWDGTNRYYMGIPTVDTTSWRTGLGDSYLDVSHNMSDGVWYQWAMSGDGSTCYIYKEGSQVNSFAYSLTAALGYSYPAGAYNNQGTIQRFHEGILDEVRLSEASRSSAWIKATYYSGDDNLVTWASEEARQSVSDSGSGSYLSKLSLSYRDSSIGTDFSLLRGLLSLSDSSLGNSIASILVKAFSTYDTGTGSTIPLLHLSSFDYSVGKVPVESQVGEWLFNSGKGDIAYDSSGKHNDGKIYGATWTSGKSGYALEFDGADDYVEVPDDPNLDLDSALTVSAWIYPTTLGVTQHICAKGTVGSKDTNWQFFIRSDNKLMGGADIAGSWTRDSTFTVEANKWQYVALVVDGGKGAITYLNGQQGTLAEGTGAITTNDRIVSVGARSDVASFFHGSIDDVRIYDRALSPQEIKALYEGKEVQGALQPIMLCTDETVKTYSTSSLLGVSSLIDSSSGTSTLLEALTYADSGIGTSDSRLSALLSLLDSASASTDITPMLLVRYLTDSANGTIDLYKLITFMIGDVNIQDYAYIEDFKEDENEIYLEFILTGDTSTITSKERALRNQAEYISKVESVRVPYGVTKYQDTSLGKKNEIRLSIPHQRLGVSTDIDEIVTQLDYDVERALRLLRLKMRFGR